MLWRGLVCMGKNTGIPRNRSPIRSCEWRKMSSSLRGRRSGYPESLGSYGSLIRLVTPCTRTEQPIGKQSDQCYGGG